MEAALELQDFVAAAEGAGDAEGLEAGIGAAGGEADLVGAREGADEFLGKLDGVLVGGEEGAAALDGFDDGLDNLGVGVAEDHGTGTHEVVDVLVSRDVPDAGAAALFDDEGVVIVEGDVAEGAFGEKFYGLLQEKGFFVSTIQHGGLRVGDWTSTDYIWLW